jgi:enamine deaminase RidA (YjgF/YER057c/UK114 family)
MIKKSIKYFTDNCHSSFELNILSCIDQINEYFNYCEITKDNIALVSVFIRSDDKDHLVKSKLLRDEFYTIFPDVPISIISQAPFKKNIVVELFIINGKFSISNTNNTVRVYEFEDHGELYFAGESHNGSKDCLINSISAFEEFENSLIKANFEFNNIIRQWNYIGDILKVSTSDNIVSQNYQIFNNVRTEYYKKYNWSNGYPSATGIGAVGEYINISSIAFKGSSHYPLRNPYQTDAHSYSGEVLIGNDSNKKSTPKFERGKIVFFEDSFDLYISGTAAIKGEEHFRDDNVREQTLMTIENIHALIQKENITKQIPEKYHKLIPDDINKEISYLRAYVKYEKDISIVKEIIIGKFGNIPSIYTVADICREDLLVEIEAVIFNNRIEN